MLYKCLAATWALPDFNNKLPSFCVVFKRIVPRVTVWFILLVITGTPEGRWHDACALFTSRVDYCSVLCLGLEKHLEILIGIECCSPYHSSLGPSTLTSSLFLGTIQGAGLDLQSPIRFGNNIPEGLPNHFWSHQTIIVVLFVCFCLLRSGRWQTRKELPWSWHQNSTRRFICPLLLTSSTSGRRRSLVQ